MGGRGASSGVSIEGKRYGTEYRTLYKSGNIKFVQATSHESKMFETQTKGRVYVEVNKNGQLKTIYYFDNNLKRSKSIDLRHTHKGMIPHTHHGYEHGALDGAKGATRLTDKERKLLDKVTQIWDNRGSK